jgi:hypothetical protein
MTPEQALALVAAKGVVLESGRGPVPNLAEAVTGEPIRGSWWAHRKSKAIFRCSRAVRDADDVLLCRLVGGKLTYVHRRLWPALVRLAPRFDASRLAAITEVHTDSGKHEIRTTAFPAWVPEEVQLAAERLSQDEAAALLPVATGTRSYTKRKMKGGRRSTKRAK